MIVVQDHRTSGFRPVWYSEQRSVAEWGGGRGGGGGSQDAAGRHL